MSVSDYDGRKPEPPYDSDDELTAANERIRELEKLLEDANRGAQRNAIINQSLAGKLTAERAISDKLEKALGPLAGCHLPPEGFEQHGVTAHFSTEQIIFAKAAIAEVAAMRK